MVLKVSTSQAVIADSLTQIGPILNISVLFFFTLRQAP